MPVIPILAVTTIVINKGAYYSAPMRDPSGPVSDDIWSSITFVWRTLFTLITQSTTGTVMPQGWTLYVEYQGSLLVFTCCLAFARVSALVRSPCVLGLLFAFLNLSQWQPCLFLAGMILADIRHVRQKLPPLTGAWRKVADVASWLLFVLALFLGGWPQKGNAYAATGYSWFYWVPTAGIDHTYFFPSISAIALVAALDNLPVLQRALSSRLMLYLGEISFALYLVHISVGRSSITWGLRYQMVDAGYTMGVAWTVTFVIMLFLSIWLADIHWRLCDKKSVQFAHWLSKRLGV
ncbi:uncharacterized protein ColSpa_03452 [Colletotrichum spaethianum]|uniref:Acyltransferase 3 domain-containing protein n=1 Tax=Colletotrichum spaethianum TaxID=700344 RepID=A0AA37L762_9PEZI|nr:uncharacterized protein ColSpa_03452 [Colletotrichum spaethianum]GKT43271.1 hypothetical protein ColSpa_03452 [Colletotrichum spaethianum]